MKEDGYLHKISYPQCDTHQGYIWRAPIICWKTQTPTYTMVFCEMCANLTDCGFNTEYFRSSLLKKELILVFLFSKYNIVSSPIKEVYLRDVVLLSWILRRRLFGVTDIMYLLVIQCILQTRDCLQHPRTQKPVLVLSSLIMQICLKYGIDMSSIDIITLRMEPLSDATIRRSLSARPNQVPDSDL